MKADFLQPHDYSEQQDGKRKSLGRRGSLPSSLVAMGFCSLLGLQSSLEQMEAQVEKLEKGRGRERLWPGKWCCLGAA